MPLTCINTSYFFENFQRNVSDVSKCSANAFKMHNEFEKSRYYVPLNRIFVHCMSSGEIAGGFPFLMVFGKLLLWSVNTQCHWGFFPLWSIFARIKQPNLASYFLKTNASLCASSMPLFTTICPTLYYSKNVHIVHLIIYHLQANFVHISRLRPQM